MKKAIGIACISMLIFSALFNDRCLTVKANEPAENATGLVVATKELPDLLTDEEPIII